MVVEKEIVPPNIDVDPDCEIKLFRSPLDNKITVVVVRGSLEICHICGKPFIETDLKYMSGEFEIIGDNGKSGGTREKLHRSCHAEFIRKKYL